MTVNFYSYKGGVGLTTMATTAALQLAHRERRVIHVAVLDEAERREVARVAGGWYYGADSDLHIPIGEGEIRVVVDSDLDWDDPDVRISHHPTGGEHNVLVTRACYLALSRFLDSGDEAPDVVALVAEPERLLPAREVGLAIGAPVVEFPWDPRINSAVDAGTLCHQAQHFPDVTKIGEP